MPLSFHIQNLNINKIILSNNKLKNLLQSLREKNFQKDVIYKKYKSNKNRFWAY